MIFVSNRERVAVTLTAALCCFAMFISVLAWCGCGVPRQQLPPKKNLTYEDRMRWKEILHWPDTFDQVDEVTDGDMRFHQIDESKTLIEVLFCPGNRFSNSYIFLLDESTSPVTVKPVRLPVYLEDGKIELRFGLFGYSYWDQENRVLTRFDINYRRNGVAFLSRYLVDPPDVELLDVRRAECDEGRLLGGFDQHNWTIVFYNSTVFKQRPQLLKNVFPK